MYMRTAAKPLRGLCKTALFVLRAQNYYETGVFLRTGCELEAALDGQAACVLCGTQAFAAGTAGFEETCDLLLNWTGGLIRRYGEARRCRNCGVQAENSIMRRGGLRIVKPPRRGV